MKFSMTPSVYVNFLFFAYKVVLTIYKQSDPTHSFLSKDHFARIFVYS